ncbi:MAG: tetratricopeptide repeat protein [Sphingomonas sp.]|uniref:tetratricopeptide repeat protein n=1 Tax=Sphingomonas sp. TaxID=28214 RepID=UPI003F8238D3
MILLPLMLQAGSTPTLTPIEQRYRSCLALASSDPKAAEAEADRFRLAGGGARARQCQGMAYAQEARWGEAAAAFEAAARDADATKDALAARYWAQAGNAWLAAGQPAKAQTALTTAITAGTLDPFGRGEALLDRARAQVAGGQPASARSDIDAALEAAPKDPLAWLLSATLARRTNDLTRAKSDIAEAVRLASDDASVQLEAGNIAALSGDVEAAKAAWQAAVKLAPGTAAGVSARTALAQFDAPPPAAAAPATPAPAQSRGPA